MGELDTRELCRAPKPHSRYSLSKLYHPGMRDFERVATGGNKEVLVMPLFNPHFLTNRVS